MWKPISGLSLALALLPTGVEKADAARARDAERSDAWKIENALSAGPKVIADHATVMDWPAAEGQKMRVLREGTNGWMCMPGRTWEPRPDPMCVDKTMMKWMMAKLAHRKPNIDRIGLAYMLQGEVRADPNDFYAHAPPPGKDWTYVGPHIMVVLPDASTKDALRGQNHDVSTGEPFVTDSTSSSPLLVIPIAKGDEEIVVEKITHE
jgi:hypothetical protein